MVKSRRLSGAHAQCERRKERSPRGVKSAARDGRGAKMLRIFVNSDGSAGGTARVLCDECFLPVDKCLLLFLFLGLLCYVNNIV